MAWIPHSQTDSPLCLLPFALMSFAEHEKLMLCYAEPSHLALECLKFRACQYIKLERCKELLIQYIVLG